MHHSVYQADHPLRRSLAYLSAKLAAAGIVFLTLMLLLSRFDIVQLQETMFFMPFWTIFYGYAVVFSMLVDALALKLRRPYSGLVSVLLYVAGGYAPFFLFFSHEPMLIVIAGLYGLVCALCFYGIDASLRRRWPLGGILALVMLAALGWLALVDHTRVEGWTEQRSETAFTAQFDLLHGEFPVPIELRRGETLTYKIEFRIDRGGYGYSLAGPKGQPIGMEQLADGRMQVTADRDMEVQVLISGRRASGAVTVSWEVSN